jgi:hypothetical protein
MTDRLFTKYPTPWTVRKTLVDDGCYDCEIRDAKGRLVANVLDEPETALDICELANAKEPKP